MLSLLAKLFRKKKLTAPYLDSALLIRVFKHGTEDYEECPHASAYSPTH